MATIRTQIYLTSSQRRKLDLVSRTSGKSLAQIIREAVDAYIDTDGESAEEALKATFGSAPDLSVPPREEWERIA